MTPNASKLLIEHVLFLFIRSDMIEINPRTRFNIPKTESKTKESRKQNRKDVLIPCFVRHLHLFTNPSHEH